MIEKSGSLRIGAVMPTYNQREFIEAALASAQDQVDVLVVVDDGSADGTREFLRSMEGEAGLLICRHGRNLGTAAAINTGRERLAGCDWLTWISSDNTFTSNWMERLIAHLDDDVGVVYSGFWWEKGPTRQYHFTAYDPGRLIRDQNCFFGPSFIIRADVWQDHRGRISHDYDNWLRVEEACWERGLRIVGVAEGLCHYNAHDKRATETRRHQYDAPFWQAEARARRAGHVCRES